MNLVLKVIIGFSIAEYSVGVGGCWRPVKNGEGRVSLKYKHMQCTCIRCYNFYHPAPPSIYASLTLLSKTRLPYPSIHLSVPVPPLVQVSAALSIHPFIHPTIPPLIPSLAPRPSPIHPSMSHIPLSKSHPPSIHTSIHPSTHPPIHPSINVSHPLVQVSSPPSIHASHIPMSQFHLHIFAIRWSNFPIRQKNWHCRSLKPVTQYSVGVYWEWVCLNSWYSSCCYKLQPCQKHNITQYEELGFYQNLLRWEMNILPILTSTWLIYFSSKG